MNTRNTTTERCTTCRSFLRAGEGTPTRSGSGKFCDRCGVGMHPALEVQPPGARRRRAADTEFSAETIAKIEAAKRAGIIGPSPYEQYIRGGDAA